MRHVTHTQMPRIHSATRLRTALSTAVALFTLAVLVVGSASAVTAARPTARPSSHTSAKSRVAQFKSPSKNIYCNITPGGRYNQARCDIRKHTFTPPPKPASCHFDWGFSVKVKVRAHWNCVSDAVTSSPHVPTLDYGHSRTVGHVRCISRRTAMVCRNLNSGHGFRLSRAAVKLF